MSPIYGQYISIFSSLVKIINFMFNPPTLDVDRVELIVFTHPNSLQLNATLPPSNVFNDSTHHHCR